MLPGWFCVSSTLLSWQSSLGTVWVCDNTAVVTLALLSDSLREHHGLNQGWEIKGGSIFPILRMLD